MTVLPPDEQPPSRRARLKPWFLYTVISLPICYGYVWLVETIDHHMHQHHGVKEFAFILIGQLLICSHLASLFPASKERDKPPG